MLKCLKLLVGVMLISWLAGCAIAPTQGGQFGTVPVDATDITIYQCSATKESFTKYQPELGSLQLMPFAATVIDGGANWVATYPGGKVTSPQLYKDLLGKIDGAVDMITGQRFYKIRALGAKAPIYSTSTVDPLTGNGDGMTFLQCTLAPEPGEALTK